MTGYLRRMTGSNNGRYVIVNGYISRWDREHVKPIVLFKVIVLIVGPSSNLYRYP